MSAVLLEGWSEDNLSLIQLHSAFFSSTSPNYSNRVLVTGELGAYLRHASTDKEGVENNAATCRNSAAEFNKRDKRTRRI
jgi:hypothetical protein